MSHVFLISKQFCRELPIIQRIAVFWSQRFRYLSHLQFYPLSCRAPIIASTDYSLSLSCVYILKHSAFIFFSSYHSITGLILLNCTLLLSFFLRDSSLFDNIITILLPFTLSISVVLYISMFWP